MLVYGDHDRSVATRDHVAALMARARRLDALSGLAWHGGCAALFVDLAGLLQAVADRRFADRGTDETDVLQGALMALLVDLARAIDASWSSGLARQALPASFARLPAIPLPRVLTIRRCEGFAFYALYPETVLAAARALPADTVVIGLRSIGTALAALAAAACGTDIVHTLRPTGPPFSRRPAAGPHLSATLRAMRGRTFAIADEGPGLSGSSFGGTADWLVSLGVARERIVLLPSHAGEPGAEATPARRAQWRAAPRLVASFDEVVLNGRVPVSGWFADLVGPATEPLIDLSGGGWRRHGPWPDAPADPGREARKLLLTTASGRYLLKFAGVDGAGADKLARARALSAAGFAPEPLALRHGLMIERWMPAAVPARAQVLAVAGRYLAFRAQAFAAAAPGATLRTLVAMARQNIAEGTGRAPRLDGWSEARIAALQARVRPVQIDGRMQPWEWIATPDGIRKTDALDHAQAHDLVGCQDIAWDVAGMVAESALDPDERAALIARTMPGRPEAGDLVALLEPCYLAFQLGWWSFAADTAALRHRALCHARVAAWLEAEPIRGVVG